MESTTSTAGAAPRVQRTLGQVARQVGEADAAQAGEQRQHERHAQRLEAGRETAGNTQAFEKKQGSRDAVSASRV